MGPRQTRSDQTKIFALFTAHSRKSTFSFASDAPKYSVNISDTIALDWKTMRIGGCQVKVTGSQVKVSGCQVKAIPSKRSSKRSSIMSSKRSSKRDRELSLLFMARSKLIRKRENERRCEKIQNTYRVVGEISYMRLVRAAAATVESLRASSIVRQFRNATLLTYYYST